VRQGRRYHGGVDSGGVRGEVQAEPGDPDGGGQARGDAEIAQRSAQVEPEQGRRVPGVPAEQVDGQQRRHQVEPDPEQLVGQVEPRSTRRLGAVEHGGLVRQ
jgi:hypothetical protein